MRELHGSLSGGGDVPYSLGFLGVDTYHAEAFTFMQRQWDEEIAKMLRDDPQFSRSYVFSGGNKDTP